MKSFLMAILSVICWLIFIIIMLIVIFGAVITIFIDLCTRFCANLVLVFKDHKKWSLDLSNKRISLYYGAKGKANDSIEDLIRDLIKANFCRDVLCNPTMTEQKYKSKMEQLKNLEMVWPELVKDYSPTKYSGFREDKAIEAFNLGKDDSWEVVKRTLWLTRDDMDIHDIPPIIRTRQVVIIPKSDEFGI